MFLRATALTRGGDHSRKSRLGLVLPRRRKHGPFDLETLQDLCRAAIAAGMAPIVRIADVQYHLVARTLDCGAMGILLPRIESPEVLARAASWTFFPPVGIRGFRLHAAQRGLRTVNHSPNHPAHQHDNTMLVFQIETLAGLERRDELVFRARRVDVPVMIGPADLSISLGIPGQFENPKLIDAIDKIIETCNKYGVAPGILMRPLHLAKFWRDRGMRFLSTGGDALFLYDKASEAVKTLRE